MHSPIRIRPVIFGTGLFVAGLAVGTAIASWASAPSHLAVHEGATLVSVLPKAVLALSYASPTGMTTAQRATSGTPFHLLSTFADGRPVQRCTMPADMEGRLDKLTTLIARRELSLQRREAEFPVQLGVIEVRDAMLAEPSGPVLVYTNKSRTAVAVILDGRAVEVTLKPAELRWLETACSA